METTNIKDTREKKENKEKKREKDVKKEKKEKKREKDGKKIREMKIDLDSTEKTLDTIDTNTTKNTNTHTNTNTNTNTLKKLHIQDETSLQYLINPIVYNKILKKNVEKGQPDIDFYRERILNATNCLLDGYSSEGEKHDTIHNTGIKDIFLQYCKILISHFIQEDTDDFYQSELINYNNSDGVQDISCIDRDRDASGDRDIDRDLSIANNRVAIDKGLENFVIKTTNISSITKHILPRIKTVDITTHAHKFKGIKQ